MLPGWPNRKNKQGEEVEDEEGMGAGAEKGARPEGAAEVLVLEHRRADWLCCGRRAATLDLCR